MVVINQSDAGLQRLPSYPGFKPGVTNPGLPLIAKMQKKLPQDLTFNLGLDNLKFTPCFKNRALHCISNKSHIINVHQSSVI